MTPLVHELAVDGYPVAVTCRVLKVSTSTYYDWLKPRPPSRRDLADAYLLDAIIDIHRTARGTYGVRRVHAELTLGRQLKMLPATGRAADAPARPVRGPPAPVAPRSPLPGGVRGPGQATVHR